MKGYKKYYDKDSTELFPRSTIYKRIAKSKQSDEKTVHHPETHSQNNLPQIVSFNMKV